MALKKLTLEKIRQPGTCLGIILAITSEKICLTLGLSVAYTLRKNKLIKLISFVTGVAFICASFIGVL